MEIVTNRFEKGDRYRDVGKSKEESVRGRRRW